MARFGQVMTQGEVMLDAACFAVSSSLCSPFDEIEWIARIDRIAGECPSPTPAGVARYLFGDLGYAGNTSNYFDWRNSCLDIVVTRRRGIPLTLSILLIEVAKRLGVKLVGVGMPAHFLVADESEPGRFFDPFAGGAEVDSAGARAMFEHLTNGKVPWQDSFLTASDSRSIVNRLLNNLCNIFQSSNDVVRLGIVMQLRAQMHEVSDSEHHDIVAATALFN